MNRKMSLLFLVLLVFQIITAHDQYAGLPAYQQIVAEQKSLADKIAALTSLLSNPYMSPSSAVSYVPTTIAPGKPVTTVQVPLRMVTTFYSQEDQQNYTYQQVSTQMATLLGASGYSLVLKQAWEFYNQVGAPASAFLESQSLSIQAYASLAGSAITYLKAVLATISLQNYAQPDLAAWLKKEVAALDTAVDTAAQHFKDHVGTARGDLINNFMTIQQNYHQRKAQLLLAWLEPLLKQLTALYPANIVQTQVTTDLAIQNVQTYVQLLFDSLSVFSPQQAATMLGKYGSVTDVVTAFSAQAGQLSLYQAQMFMHAVEYNIQLWGQPGATITPVQMTTLAGQIQSCATLMSSAASYYATAAQTNSAQVYAQQAAALQSGLQNWQMALKNSGQGYNGQAAQLFEQASGQFKQAGNTYVGAYLYQQFQQTLLLYDTSIIATYGNYYQPLVAQYIAQAQQLPTSSSAATMTQQHQQFQSLFYPLNSEDAQNAAYKGMAWLAQLALPSYKDVLSSLQSLNTTTQNGSQQLLLQQTITLLQSIAQGSQYMFYTSPQVFGANALPADQNSSSYTIKGLVTAIEQYNTIISLFGQADSMLTKAGAQSTLLPFAQVLPTSGPVTSWRQLIMLHQAYWFFMNAQQAYAYVAGCSPSTAQIDELIASAVVGLVHAQAVYRALSIEPMAQYIQTRLTAIVGTTTPVTYGGKTVEKILEQKAASYLVGQTPALLDRQAALTCYQIGGVLGFALCRTQFFATLDAYRTVLLAQTSGAGDITALAKAFGLVALDIQGMYAQKAGWQTTQVYVDNFSTDSALLSQQLQSMGALSGTIDQQIALQKQFVYFYEQYQAFGVEEKRLAALYELTMSPYLSTKNLGGNQVAFYASTSAQPLAILLEPSYQLALLLSQSASAQLTAVQQSLKANTFTGSLLGTIGTIEDLYNQAIAYYSQAGLQDAVVKTEQLKTKAMAVLYYALVVPSQKVLSLQAKISSSAPVQVAAAQSSNQANLPDYLLRSVSVDLTALAKTFVTSASLTQAVTQSSSLQAVGTTNSDLTAEIAAAQQLVQDAQALVGKTTADSQQALITNVLLPLYRLQLQQEGYTGFLTLDQKVQQYQNQITTLMSTGMNVGSVTYKASYSVVSQKNADGTDHIIVQGTNVPLPAVIQYQGQTESALLYYTLCDKFYDTSQQTTSVGDATYMTVSDPDAQQMIADAKTLTYVVGAQTYIDQVTTYLATLTLADGKTPLGTATLAQKANLSFVDYQAAYNAINNLYINALSLLDAINTDQTSSIDIDTQKTALYSQFAQTCSYFLMGDPSSGSFQSVLKDVANNYFSANQTQPMALLYEAAADYACTLPLALTQTNGYPSATATLPQDPTVLGSVTKLNQVLAKNKIASCPVAPVAPLYPYTQPLTWYNYQQAAAFYQQAYTVYQQGLTGAATSNPLQDKNAVRLYGKFFYYDFFSSMQALSLFTRNAYMVGFDTQAQTITGSMSPDFANIIKQGGSAGATTAAAGFNQLAAGGSAVTDADAAQQYTIMRSIMLNALLYLTGLQGALGQLIQTVGVDTAYTGQSVTLNNPLLTQFGQLLQCSLTQYIPGLQVLIGGSNANVVGTTGSVDTLKGVEDIPTYLLDLQNSFKPIFQARIFHANTFLTAMQYMVENSIGSPTNNFTPLGSATNSYLNLLVFNKLVGELWAVMRNLYGQAFLANLYGTQNVSAYENALDAAMSAQQQQTIINPASYIG